MIEQFVTLIKRTDAVSLTIITVLLVVGLTYVIETMINYHDEDMAEADKAQVDTQLNDAMFKSHYLRKELERGEDVQYMIDQVEANKAVLMEKKAKYATE